MHNQVDADALLDATAIRIIYETQSILDDFQFSPSSFADFV